MRPLGILTLIFLLCPSLGVPQEGASKADPPELEARLAEATGRERLDLLFELTEAYRETDPTRVVAFGTEALELLAAKPDEERKLALLIALGEANFQRHDYETGLLYSEQAEQLARATGDKPALGLALRQIGKLSWRTDARQRGLNALTEAIDLHEELGDALGLADASNYAGGITPVQNRFPGFWSLLQRLPELSHFLCAAGHKKWLNSGERRGPCKDSMAGPLLVNPSVA